MRGVVRRGGTTGAKRGSRGDAERRGAEWRSECGFERVDARTTRTRTMFADRVSSSTRTRGGECPRAKRHKLTHVMGRVRETLAAELSVDIHRSPAPFVLFASIVFGRTPTARRATVDRSARPPAHAMFASSTARASGVTPRAPRAPRRILPPTRRFARRGPPPVAFRSRRRARGPGSASATLPPRRRAFPLSRLFRTTTPPTPPPAPPPRPTPTPPRPSRPPPTPIPSPSRPGAASSDGGVPTPQNPPPWRRRSARTASPVSRPTASSTPSIIPSRSPPRVVVSIGAQRVHHGRWRSAARSHGARVGRIAGDKTRQVRHRHRRGAEDRRVHPRVVRAGGGVSEDVRHRPRRMFSRIGVFCRAHRRESRVGVDGSREEDARDTRRRSRRSVGWNRTRRFGESAEKERTAS